MKPQWFHILLCLADRDLHGLAIRDEILERTLGEMHLWPAMLYGSLKKLGDAGLISETEGPSDLDPGGGRPRVFRITAAGREALAHEVGNLSRFLDAARSKGMAGS